MRKMSLSAICIERVASIFGSGLLLNVSGLNESSHNNCCVSTESATVSHRSKYIIRKLKDVLVPGVIDSCELLFWSLS